MGGRQFRPEARDGGYNSCVQWPADFSGRKQLSRTPHGWIQATLQSDRGMVRTCCARHLFRLRGSASERCLAIERFAGIQRRENELAMCGHLDGDSYEINEFIVNHREGIGKPVISTEGFSRFPRTLLVARRHGRELQAGKTFDGWNVRQIRPTAIGVCTDDSDTNLFLN